MTSETSGGSDATPPPADQDDRRRELIGVWQQACVDVLDLLETLSDEDWSQATDLPGWDVKAVAAHLAHLESELAGMPQEQVEVEPAEHVRNVLAQYTEVGPTARRDWPPARIIEELREAVRLRTEAMERETPDLTEQAPSFAALAGWTWETLLSNRPVDVWMHEQDIRAAVGRPGGLDGRPAVHVATVFARSLPMVVGKRAGATPGQSVVVRLLDAPDEAPQTLSVEVSEDGRARPTTPPSDPSAAVELSFTDWLRLCGGRCSTEGLELDLSGDRDLARRVVDALAVTP